MITKYLITGGGGDPNFGDLDSMWTYIKDQLAAGLSDNIEILVEPGATFGADPSTNYYKSNMTLTFNGYNIEIRTNPSGIATPATILGKIQFSCASSDASGHVIFRQIKLGAKNGPVIQSGQKVPAKALRCIIAIQNPSTGYIVEGAYATDGCSNCSIFLSNIGHLVSISTFASAFYNNFIGVYNTEVQNFNVVNDFRNNTIWNWGGMGFSYSGPGSPVNTIEQNPLLESQVIQSTTDSPQTMLARSAVITELSTPLRDNADDSYVPDFWDVGKKDIIGNPVS